MRKLTSIHIFALAALGEGLSGGDRIFIEFARHWKKKILIHLYVWESGLSMCQREKLLGKNLKTHLIEVGELSKLGFTFTYFYRILLGLKLGLTLKLHDEDCVYSASEFWMDSLPAFILKLRYPQVKWAAAWYQTAPNPLEGFAKGKRQHTYKLRAFPYWLVQKSIKPIISRFADFILVSNTNEQKQFIKQFKEGKTITVLGAVRTDEVIRYQRNHPKPKKKQFLAVFQGRFHPQKGVVELIDIWKEVTKKIPDAKLAMIGSGPLINDVKERIQDLKIEGNIFLFGYLHDGERKYNIFNNSKMVVHPAFYDSGGMAAAEAMAFGLPCIGFNLDAYSFYYPQGMIKVPVGNLKQFASKIVQLNNDRSLYCNISKNIRNIIMEKYSWGDRSEKIFDILELSK